MIPTVKSLRIKMISNVMIAVFVVLWDPWRKLSCPCMNLVCHDQPVGSTAARESKALQPDASRRLPSTSPLKSDMVLEQASANLTCANTDEVQEFMS